MEALERTGKGSPYPKGGNFAQLFDWHLANGTRPTGHPDKDADPWRDGDFSAAIGISEDANRSFRNWRKGRHYPTLYRTKILETLFGQNDAYDEWRRELRFALPSPKPGESELPKAFAQATQIDPPPPHFLGREADVGKILDALRTAPGPAAILVHGVPGIGKTTVTQAVANHPEMLERFGDGNRWFARLENAETAEKMKDAIVRALGRDPARGLDAALNSLTGSGGLLVLDNLETPWDPKD